jgi:HTH-type transcriptional regulator/antitoxin HigA
VITNERQYRITKGQLVKLQEGLKQLDLEEISQKTGSMVLAEAEFYSLKSEIEILQSQLLEYESLKAGAITNFRAKSLKELPIMLIQARIVQHLSQRELGDLVGLKEQQIQRYESEQYASASLRRLREIADALKLSISEIAEISPLSKLRSKSKRPISLDWSQFPVREMYKRNWFNGFRGSFEALALEANELVEAFIKAYIKEPNLVLYRQQVRVGQEFNPYALMAWECRILDLASSVEMVQEYRPELLTDEWIENLRKLSKQNNGPWLAKEKLKEVGVILVVEPHLPGTYLDGAAMLLNGERPVIGMTLRYDRLDNFWFVLFHELCHVIKHLQKEGLDKIFDDLDVDDKEGIEKEADTFASETLIPAKEWEKALARFTQSKESVRSFASKLGIHSSIVAGRIRKEANDFTILPDLIGQGEVRKLFPEAKFGV